MNARRRNTLLATAVAVAAAVIVGIFFTVRQGVVVPIAGMVRQTEIRIAPEITGRLHEIAVQPGQTVKKGELLAVLDNPELAASLGEAKAAARSAKAERDHIYAGVRAEQVGVLAESVQTAEANLQLAEQENTRTTALAARNYASRQSLDERTATLARTQADLESKRAQLEAARAGPTAEERALADARVALADGKVASLQARLDKARLIAPVDGTVDILVAERGEVIPVGKPILTLEASKERWFAFTLREDQLHGLNVGRQTTLTTDDGQRIAARVTELRPLGEFATWRAARAVGDHDLNSFRLRLEPIDAKDSSLRPGMTVWLAGN